MKSNLMILLRSNFQMLWGSMRYNKRRKKFIPLTALIVLGGGLTVAVMTFYAIMQVMLFQDQGTPEYAIYFTVAMTMLIMLLMAVIRGSSSNTSTDANFLLSLPVKRGTILLSKSLSRYAFDLLPVVVVMLPCIVVYAVMVDSSPLILLRGLVTMLLAPLMSVGLAYILSFLVYKASSRFRRPEYIRTILMLVITIVFMIFIMGMSGSMGAGTDLTAFMDKIPPLAWGAEFAAFGGLDKLLLYALVTILPFAVGVWLQARIYGVNQTRWRAGKTALAFRQRSPVRALFGKEIHQYFSVPIYVVNTIIGPVLAVVFTVALALARNTVIGFLQSDPDLAVLSGEMAILLLTALMFCGNLTAITASSISLEGKNIRILRAAPVAERDVFKSKILVHLILVLPVMVICAFVIGLTMQFGWLETVLIALCVTAATLLTAVWGLYANLIFPKLDWDNETTVVKQSSATMIAILSSFLISATPVILYFSLGSGFILAAALATALLALLAVAVWAALRTNGVKRYREL